MFFARSHLDLHNIRHSIERIGNLSDNIVHLGPVKIGLDGILTWIPGLGGLYSAGAGVLLIVEGVRARIAPTTLMTAAVLIGIRTFVSEIPLPIADLAVDLFTAHKWSADMLAKAMDETVYVEGTRKEAEVSPEFQDLMTRIKTGKETRRVVFLG